MNYRIRRARLDDAAGIHAVHMRSIREVCGAHYTPEQIDAWGGRAYSEEHRHQRIARDWVWVLERSESGAISGYLHLNKDFDVGGEHLHVGAFYLEPESIGQGWGKRMWIEAEALAARLNLHRIRLSSTINAEGFYRKLGFENVGPSSKSTINGVAIPCQVMEKHIAPSRLRLAVYALLRSEGHILAAKLAGGPNHGRWHLPGGGLDFGEDPLDGLTREIFEEADLRLAREIFQFREVLSWRVRLPQPQGHPLDLHTVGLLYEAEIPGRPAVKQSPDGLSSLGCEWIDPNSTDPETMVSQLRRVLKR